MGTFFSKIRKRRHKSKSTHSNSSLTNDSTSDNTVPLTYSKPAWNTDCNVDSIKPKPSVSKSKRNSVQPDDGYNIAKYTGSATALIPNISHHDVNLFTTSQHNNVPNTATTIHTRSQSQRSPQADMYNTSNVNGHHVRHHSRNSITGSNSSPLYTPSLYSNINQQTTNVIQTPYTALPTPSILHVRHQSSDGGTNSPTGTLQQQQIEQIHQLAYQQAYQHILQQQQLALQSAMQSQQHTRRISVTSPSLPPLHVPPYPYTPVHLYQYEISPDHTPRLATKLADITEHSNTVSAPQSVQVSSIKRSLPQPPALQTDNISQPTQHNMTDSVTYFHDHISPLQQLLQQQNTTAQPPEPIMTKPVMQRPLSYGDQNTGDWKRGELLGSGACGQVYLALHLVTGQLMAVKQVPLNNSNKANTAITALQHEIDVMYTLQHDNIVQYLGTERTATHLNIFLEYVPGGSISSLLKKFGKFNHTLVKIYTKQILSGLQYLHSNNIAHRDIKGGNILVDNSGVCKLADFGAATQLTELNLDSPQSLHGTVQFMAPEVIKQQGTGRSADIWSLGCTVLEMLTGRAPWSQYHTTVSAMYHIANTNNLPDIPAELDTEATHFLVQCFHREPYKRPSAQLMLNHPWLTGQLLSGCDWCEQYDTYVTEQQNKPVLSTPYITSVNTATTELSKTEPILSATTVQITLPSTEDTLSYNPSSSNSLRPTPATRSSKRRSSSTRNIPVSSQVRSSAQADALFTVLNDRFSRTPSTDPILQIQPNNTAQQTHAVDNTDVSIDYTAVQEQTEILTYINDQLKSNVLDRYELQPDFHTRLSDVVSRSATPSKRRSVEPSYASPLIVRRTLPTLSEYAYTSDSGNISG